MRRVGLPPGGSTLTTSAPSPASVSPQYSACSSQSSMTRLPESGPRPVIEAAAGFPGGRGAFGVSGAITGASARRSEPLIQSVSGIRCRLVREQLLDAVPDLVDLLDAPQECH